MSESAQTEQFQKVLNDSSEMQIISVPNFEIKVSNLNFLHPVVIKG